MLFFFRSIFVQLFLNAYIFYRIRKSGDISTFWKYVLISIYIAETLMYFTGLLTMHSLPIELIATIQKISGIWVIYQVYLVLLILIFDLVFYLKRRFVSFDKFNEKRIKKIKIITFLSINILIGTNLTASYHNYTHPVVKTYDFTFDSTRPLSPVTPHSSPARHSYKILMASDQHLGYIVDKQMLSKYVNLINSQHPDIIIFNGDLLDWGLYPLVQTGMQEELKKIKAPKGVYFVPGNHEYRHGIDKNLNWIAQNNIVVLKDTIVSIDDKLCLIGRDEVKNENRKSMAELMKDFDTSKPCIMFAHRPSNIKDACEYNIPLTICGHTHHGQIFPANLFCKWQHSNPYGWKEINGCYSYTTSGLGLSGFPLRSGSRCEAVVLNIRIN